MSRVEDVNTAIWGDEDFDGLSPLAAFLYLWSFTNPRCGMAGIYKVSRRQICEGRLTETALENALAELSQAQFLFYEDGLLWVRTRIKYLRTKGGPMKRGIEKELRALPQNHPLLYRLVEEYRGSWIQSVLEGGTEGVPIAPEGVPENGSNKPNNGTPQGVPEGFQGKGYGKGQGKEEKKQNGVDRTELPENFDAQLGAEAKAVLPVLQRVAQERGAQLVTLLAVARAVETYPRRDYMRVAGELEHWTLHGKGQTRQAKDIVARYRNFLDGSPEYLRPKASEPPIDRSIYDAKVIEG